MPRDLCNLFELIENCEISVNNDVISKELLLINYSKFISNNICEKEHSIGVMLHTGSICFDIISIVYAALSCLLYDENSPEEIVGNLKEGDLILYEKNRAMFCGFDSEGRLLARQETKKGKMILNLIKSIPKTMFWKIKPYNGNSKTLDGRGIRNSSKKRNSFIETVFGEKSMDISSIVNKSIVIVIERPHADYIINNTEIRFGSKQSIRLTELITASYYTENEEYAFSGNSAKTEPALKLTGKISYARQMILEDQDKRIIGLMVLSKQIVDSGKSELIGLMKRRSLLYAFVCYIIDLDDNKAFSDELPESNLFACTKASLEPYEVSYQKGSRHIEELNKQISNKIHKEIEVATIDGITDWGTYKTIKGNLHFIKSSGYADENINYFVVSAYSLLNLISTAIFPLEIMEQGILNGDLGCCSPQRQLDKIKEISGLFSGLLAEKMAEIWDELSLMYEKIFYQNEKFDFIYNILLKYNRKKRAALIVPKAYYSMIIDELLYRKKLELPNLEIVTANRFQNSTMYEEIIVAGVFSGKKFNIFSCNASSHIIIVSYPFEHMLFRFMKKVFKENETIYNVKAKINQVRDAADETMETGIQDEIEEINVIDNELIDFIDQVTVQSALHSIEAISNGNKSVVTSEIVRVATFGDNETAFFTKHYSPYLLDRENSTVTEEKVENLQVGDILVFTRYSEQTKDIVDEILNNMFLTNVIGAEVIEFYRKSKHWKKVLKKHIDENNLSFKDISKEMAKYGISKHEATLRTWLNEDGHIVGPREVDSFYEIALICGDEEMQNNPDSFFEACNAIRSLRIKILKLIGISIIKNLQGNNGENEDLLLIVQEKVDELSQVVQIESISNVSDIRVPAYLSNRPYLI